MTMKLSLLSRIFRHAGGSMVIETAIVTPVLAMLSLGAFDASRMVARQTELQQAMSEAAQIAIVYKPDTAAKRTKIRDIIVTSTGLANSNVTITNEFRCGATTTRVATNTCSSGTAVTTYLKIVVTDTYTPVWNDFGIGSSLNFNMTRLVIVA
jgi:Flp pilus assembly protein TadG